MVVTIGKFSVGDVFDTNSYAHDPRSDFLNWTLIDAGSFDYAADAWGYTYGASLELYKGRWAFRTGMFDLSKVPNSETLETGFVTFWSRTRQKLWMKGETSGNRLRVIDASTDCDNDALLFRVEVEGDGLVCHEGTVSCFTKDISIKNTEAKNEMEIA